MLLSTHFPSHISFSKSIYFYIISLFVILSAYSVGHNNPLKWTNSSSQNCLEFQPEEAG